MTVILKSAVPMVLLVFAPLIAVMHTVLAAKTTHCTTGPPDTAPGNPTSTISPMAAPVTVTFPALVAWPDSVPKAIEAVVVSVRGDCGNTP